MYIIMAKKRRRPFRGKRFIYRIWYGDEIIYVGQTSQWPTAVLRRHFFAPNKKFPKIDVLQVTKIDMQSHKTLADCALYVCYYRNKFKPRYNGPQWEGDRLTITLPRVKWIEYTTPLMERWREEAVLIREHRRDELKAKKLEWAREAIHEQNIRVPKIHFRQTNVKMHHIS